MADAIRHLPRLPFHFAQCDFMTKDFHRNAVAIDTKLVYFEKEDILYLTITDEPESGSIEVSPNITAELNERGELIGIEILNASTFIK